MAKRIRRDTQIYIAPKIFAFYEGDIPVAIDESRSDLRMDPRELDVKIRIYERQVKGWFLNRATNLLKNKDNVFVGLMICLSYLEGVEQNMLGTKSDGRSKEFFRKSIHRIYPDFFNDPELNMFYSEARCGLFHSGMVGGKIIVSLSYSVPIEFPEGSDQIKVNPLLLLNDIKNDFKIYLKNLRKSNNSNLRANFNTMFSNI